MLNLINIHVKRAPQPSTVPEMLPVLSRDKALVDTVLVFTHFLNMVFLLSIAMTPALPISQTGRAPKIPERLKISADPITSRAEHGVVVTSGSNTEVKSAGGGKGPNTSVLPEVCEFIPSSAEAVGRCCCGTGRHPG